MATGSVAGRRRMVISPLWLQGALLTFVVGFAVMGFLAINLYRDQPPIPGRTVDAAGQVIFTREDVLAGQGVFQKYGLMEHGSVLGHGAYLGPDFTAEYLHLQAEEMTRLYGGASQFQGAIIPNVRVVQELHQNAYDAATDTLTFSEGQASSFARLVQFNAERFNQPVRSELLPAQFIWDPQELRQLTAFFVWTAWTATANRPGFGYSYTNNWPPEILAGNLPTAEAVVWSALSIVALLFLLQAALGGLLAHYRAEPLGTFFGVDLSGLLPYNLSRTWHVQLSIFWVAAAYLGAGIFITPLIAPWEPRGQAFLAYLLLGAVAVVVFGSLLGEAASTRNLLGGLWFWLGHQGWEYLDLGRFWQVLLTLGLFFWGSIIYRGLRPDCWRTRAAALPRSSSGASGWFTCGSRTSWSCSRPPPSPMLSCCSASSRPAWRL